MDCYKAQDAKKSGIWQQNIYKQMTSDSLPFLMCQIKSFSTTFKVHSCQKDFVSFS